MALTERQKKYRATKIGHLSRFLQAAKTRAKNQNVPFDLTLEFLESIAVDACPVFNVRFTWGQGKGKNPYRPSLDRIIPELGYVQYNVAFISLKANIMKQDITEVELYAVADWLHDKRKEVLDAKANSTTSVSTGSNKQSKYDPQLRFVFTTGPRENDYHLDHHRRTVSRENTDHCTEESGRDSLGHRSEEVGSSETSEGEQNYGKPPSPFIWP